MSKLTELFRQHSLSTVKHAYHGEQPARSYGYYDRQQPEKDLWGSGRAALVAAYGDKVKCENKYASFACNDKCTHFMVVHLQVDPEHKELPPVQMFGYSWAGQGYLIAKTPLSADLLHELNTLKEDELKAARQRRFNTVKNPRDAVRLTFKELGIETTAVSGNQRVDCGPFDMEFQASKDSDTKVEVVFVYRTTNYVREIKLVTLNIADPDFAKRVEAVVHNGKNLNKLMLGEVQPKPVN